MRRQKASGRKGVCLTCASDEEPLTSLCVIEAMPDGQNEWVIRAEKRLWSDVLQRRQKAEGDATRQNSTWTLITDDRVAVRVGQFSLVWGWRKDESFFCDGALVAGPVLELVKNK